MALSIEIVLVCFVVAAAFADLRSRHIPNRLTLPAAALGLAMHTWLDGLNGALASVEGAAVGLGIFIVFFLLRGMGAGDVKLFGAVGALAGPGPLVLIFVFTGLLGGVVAGAVAFRRGHLRSSLPYGAVIAAGTLVSLFVVH